MGQVIGWSGHRTEARSGRCILAVMEKGTGVVDVVHVDFVNGRVMSLRDRTRRF
jgi:hypothetical protein